jgi:hypothetical protein
MNKTQLKQIISGGEDSQHVYSHLEFLNRVYMIKTIRNSLKR